MLMTNKNTKTLLIEKDKIKNKYMNNGNSIYLIELKNNDLTMLKLNSIYFKKKDERKFEFKAMKTQILKIQFVLQRT